MNQSRKHVETDKFYTRFGNSKPDALFEVFGSYCGKNGLEVRQMMIDYINKNWSNVEADLHNALTIKGKSLTWWSVSVSVPTQ